MRRFAQSRDAQFFAELKFLAVQHGYAGLIADEFALLSARNVGRISSCAVIGKIALAHRNFRSTKAKSRRVDH